MKRKQIIEKVAKENFGKGKMLCFLMLCLLFCFSLTGCKEADKDVSSSAPEDKNVELTESGYYLVEDRASAYQIVIPENAPDMITEASVELQHFLAKATGVTLQIVTDTEADRTESVISLGWTEVAEKLAVASTEEDDLKTSGYLIKTVENSVIIMDEVNGDGEGVLYGVYDFLADAIGLKFYAADEIHYEEMTSVPLYVYDDLVKPTFDIRSLSYYEMMTDETYKHRMRLVDLYNWEDMGIFGHNQVSLMTEYVQSRPEWFSSDGKQLCWSAGDEMETAFAEKMIESIQNSPEGIYFMYAQQDVNHSCSCDKCIANVATDKYGSYSALQIVFLNHVIEKVEAWREKNAPEREIRYLCYAYHMTIAAPVKEDGDGKLVAYHEECVPHEQLYIMVAPIGADYSRPLSDRRNASTLQAVQGWSAIAPGRVLIYEYDCNFMNYFVNFNNFEVVQEHYQVYDKYGVDFMYSQGPIWVSIPCFTEMRIFTESQLMWDLNQEYDDLVNEFMTVYYKDAAKQMRNFYDYILEVYREYQDNGGDGGIYGSLEEAYTMDTVKEMDALIEKAVEAIEPLRNTDNELYTTLYYRIKRESITNLWLKLNVFQLAYSEEELDKIATEFYYLCEQFDFTRNTENSVIGNMFFDLIQD